MLLHTKIINSDIVLPDPQPAIPDLNAKVKSKAFFTNVIGVVNLHSRMWSVPLFCFLFNTFPPEFDRSCESFILSSSLDHKVKALQSDSEKAERRVDKMLVSSTLFPLLNLDGMEVFLLSSSLELEVKARAIERDQGNESGVWLL